MKKIVIIGISVVLVIILGFVVYGLVVPRKSPARTATYSQNGLDIKIEYSAPFKKGRLIFGEEKDGALQPYGKYWRLGANEPTKITFSKNVSFGGQALNAGSYRLYAVPGANSWKVIVNSEIGFWGVSEPDHEHDAATAEVPATHPPEAAEQFLISFSDQADQLNLNLAWDNALVSVPITAQP